LSVREGAWADESDGRKRQRDRQTRVKQAWTQDTSQAGMDTSKRQRPVKVRQER
jgi:hypothetical protein